MGIIEHVMPAVNVGEQAHDEEPTCWCGPDVDAAFIGTPHEHYVYTHHRPPEPEPPKEAKMGGKPSRGTKADGRLKANKTTAKATTKPPATAKKSATPRGGTRKR